MKYLLFNYYQEIYHNIQKFKQRDMSVEEYLAKFENLMIKGGLPKAEESFIACYLVLTFDIARVIDL